MWPFSLMLATLQPQPLVTAQLLVTSQFQAMLTVVPCEEFWSRVINYICRSSIAQPYINALVKNSTCIPLARHTINACAPCPNNSHCADIFGTSFNPVFSERILQINPVARTNRISCANYSSFQSEGCPSV